MVKQRAKKQHYVAQSYLRRFTRDGKNLYVFDKFSKKTFGPTSVTNVAHENYFYDIRGVSASNGADETNTDPQLEEKALAALDGQFNEIIDVALKFAKGGTATPEQRMKMSLCAAVQLIRTRDYRDELVESMEQLGRASLDAALKLASPELASQLRAEFKYDKDAASALHGQFMWNPEFVSKVAAILCNHIWVIGINQTSSPLYTSDTPVVRRAHKSQPAFLPRPDNGSAFERAIDIVIESKRPGISSEGVEIVFPLSPEYVLIFLERKFFKSLEDKDGWRLVLGPAHVEDLNILQVLQSYRQIYSHTNDFSLVEKICAKYPDVCSPKRERSQISKWEWDSNS